VYPLRLDLSSAHNDGTSRTRSEHLRWCEYRPDYLPSLAKSMGRSVAVLLVRGDAFDSGTRRESISGLAGRPGGS